MDSKKDKLGYTMKKLLLLVLLLNISTVAGWVNVDSINVKQKWRNKKFNTDALLYVKSADSLLDTSNIYFKSGLIGIDTANPQRKLHLRGDIIADGSFPIYIESDDNTSTGSSIYFTSDVGLGNYKAVKLSSHSDPWSYGNFLFLVRDVSDLLGTDPTTLAYDTAMSIFSNGSVIIGDTADNTASPAKLTVYGTTQLNDDILINGKADITDTTTITSFVDIVGNTHIHDTLTVDDSIYLGGSQRIAGNLNINGNLSSANFITGNITADSLYVSTTSIGLNGNITLGSNYINYNAADAGLQFQSNSDGYFTNNVGIGIASVDGNLHVHKSTAGVVSASSFCNALVVESGTESGISILTPDAVSSNIFFGTPTDNVGSFLKWNHDNDLFEISSANAGASVSISSAADVEAIRINASQQVGIGTTGPEGKLHVFTASGGTITANANGDELILENSSTTGMSILNPDNGNGYLIFGCPTDNDYSYLRGDYTNGRLTLANSKSSGNIRFNTAGSDRVIIDSSGYMGILTTTPLYPLHVNGAATFENQVRIEEEGIVLNRTGGVGYIQWTDGSSSAQWQLRRNNTGNQLDFYSNSMDGKLNIRKDFGGSDFFSLSTTDTTGYFRGRVGIGTTSPRTPLHLHYAGETDYIRMNDSADFAMTDITSSSVFRIGTHFRDSLGFIYVKGSTQSSSIDFTNGSIYFNGNTGLTNGALYSATRRMIITGDGNVGIGQNITSATERLDIDGTTIRIRSDTTITNSTDAGNKGDICWNSSYLYVCTATNTWKRVALSTW